MVQREHSPGGRRSGQHLSEPAELLGPDTAGDGARDQAVKGDDADAADLAGRSAGFGRRGAADLPVVGVPVAVPQYRGEGDPGVVVPDTPGLGGAAVTGEGPDEAQGGGVGLWGAVISDVAADQDQVDVGHAPAVVQQLREHGSGVDTVRVGARASRDVQVRQV